MCAACPRALSSGLLLPFCKDKIPLYTWWPISWTQIYINRPGITHVTCLVDPCPKQNAGSSTATVLIETWVCFRTLKSVSCISGTTALLMGPQKCFLAPAKGIRYSYSLPSSVSLKDKTQSSTSSYQHFRTNPQYPSSSLCSIQQ